MNRRIGVLQTPALPLGYRAVDYHIKAGMRTAFLPFFKRKINFHIILTLPLILVSPVMPLLQGQGLAPSQELRGVIVYNTAHSRLVY